MPTRQLGLGNHHLGLNQLELQQLFKELDLELILQCLEALRQQQANLQGGSLVALLLDLELRSRLLGLAQLNQTQLLEVTFMWINICLGVDYFTLLKVIK